MLRTFGLSVRERAFPDHHPFSPEDLRAEEGTVILMTEKDAVKCEPFAGDNCWYVPVRAEPDQATGSAGSYGGSAPREAARGVSERTP